MRRKLLEAKYEVMHMKDTEKRKTEDRQQALEAFLAESTRNKIAGSRMLPVIDIDGKRYFVDARLKQLRNVVDPSDFIDF